MSKTKSEPITHQMPPRIAGKEGLGFIVDDPHRPPLLTHAERRRARKSFAIAAKKRAAAARGAVTINGRQVAQLYPAGGGPVPPLNPVGPNGSRRRGRNASNRHFAARLVGQAVGRRLDELADMQSQIKLAKGRGR